MKRFWKLPGPVQFVIVFVVFFLAVWGATKINAQDGREPWDMLPDEFFSTAVWDEQMYVRGFCIFRDDFWARAEADGIYIDPTDLAMENWIRDSFDNVVFLLNVEATERPDFGGFLCP